MTFSKEDKSAWMNSEIMQELEKIARETGVLEGPPAEAFLPIETEEDTEIEEPKDEEVWEEEDEDEEKLMSAIEELGLVEEPDLKEEFSEAYATNLISNLEKLAHQYATQSKMRASYRIERAIFNLKTLREESNG